MIWRILGICFIFMGVSIAWMILGTTISVRTDSIDNKLRNEVGTLWGEAQVQKAPRAYYFTEEEQVTTQMKDGKEVEVTKMVKVSHFLPLVGSDINVDLHLDHRRKGLLWYSTYAVGFKARYAVDNPTDAPITVYFEFPFPTKQAIYDDFALQVTDSDGEREIKDLDVAGGEVSQTMVVPAKGRAFASVGYLSRGMDSWRYSFGDSVGQIRDFSLTMNTDFADIDFPDEGISPSEMTKTDAGWNLVWKFNNLITGVSIALEMPHKLNPGPWVRDITYFAPISLFFFLFTMVVFTTVRKIKIHPMNYFFVAGAFFSFHLLMAYLVDHISVHLAFWIAAAVSIFLVVSYMRLVVGGRFAFLEIGISQFIYLVIFSYTFFFEGYTGLSITVLSIVTLFVVMQISGKVDWEEAFAGMPGSNTRQRGRNFAFSPADDGPGGVDR